MKQSHVILAAAALLLATVGYSAARSASQAKANDCCSGGPCCTGGACCK